MRVDLHLHTSYSYDSLTPPHVAAHVAEQRCLDAIAVTDHNAIDGALQAAKCANIVVIIGEEVASGQGDIIGLFLKEYIPPHLGALKTAEAIKEQGGLVYVPHPLCRCVPSRVSLVTLQEILPLVDVLEGINARAPFPRDNDAAQKYATSHGIALGAGSDGHFAFEVGRAGVAMEKFTNASEFLQNLRSATLFGRRTSIFQSGLTFGLMCVRRPLMRWVGPKIPRAGSADLADDQPPEHLSHESGS